jgi:trehalose/maltose hydrolase-like predicted phosphorylase
VNLPGWTQLEVIVAGRRYAAADASSYRQTLDLRRGVVTTTANWSVGGRVTRLTYDVTLDRARERVGLVRLRLTPSWSGSLRVRDVLGAGADLTPEGLRPVRATAGARNALLVVRTAGIGTTVAEAARLRVPRGASVAARADTAAMRATRTATIPVRAGRTYEVAKVVGFATSLDAGDAAGAARRAATAAPSSRGILTESAAAWARLWASDIVVPGLPELQGRVRAARFYLLASARPDVDWSISPVGLSAGGYNNHVFWDAETWMYPALLAQHPAEASTVVDYRFRTRAGARRNAERTGYGGMRFAWESALTGDEVTPTWAETGQLEQHITADVALAQWQYYLATGDQGWLRARGWPVLEGAADFWASRAERGADGGYHINQVEGPDEQNWPVDDSVYTNATAKLTLELAGRAARLLGLPAPARWSEVAGGLVVLEPRPLDRLPAVRPEFRAYAGQQVKQADVVPPTMPTRTAGPDADNQARCRPVTANAADPSAPAVAAVDGSAVTAWTPDTDPATPSTLTVRLDGTPTLGQATLTWLDARPLAPYEVQIRVGGAWRTVATVAATADMVAKVSFDPVAGDAVRLRIPATRFGGQNPKLAELAVSG